MDPRSWIIKNCAFPEPEQPQQPPNEIAIDPNEQRPLPQLEQGHDLMLPAGQVLFHGSLEEFDESQLGVGGYDGVLWTTDDKYGPAMAQSYIPRSGSSIFISPRSLVRPAQGEDLRNLQRYIGIIYDYENVEYDRLGQATSWSMPKKPDGTEWSFNELNSAVVDKLLKEKGWKPRNESKDPDYSTYEILHGKTIHDVMPPGQIAKGRLFILRAQQPLKVYDYAGNREGDLMDVDYHKTNVFKAAQEAGYDGIRINDFAQVHDHGNVGHHAIGIFQGSIAKLKWETIPATHPKMKDAYETSTPEWDEYQKRQQQAWVRSNCKFASH